MSRSSELCYYSKPGADSSCEFVKPGSPQQMDTTTGAVSSTSGNPPDDVNDDDDTPKTRTPYWIDNCVSSNRNAIASSLSSYHRYKMQKVSNF